MHIYIYIISIYIYMYIYICIYESTFTQYTPVLSEHIPYMDPMGRMLGDFLGANFAGV